MIRQHALVSLSALVIAASLAALGCEEKQAPPPAPPAPKEAPPAPKPAVTVDRALLTAYGAW